MKHYIEVIGSVDSVYVGPFSHHFAAVAYADREKAQKPQFDFYVMTEVEMQISVAEFGPAPIQAPDAEPDPIETALRAIEEALGGFALAPIGWEQWFSYAASGEWR